MGLGLELQSGLGYLVLLVQCFFLGRGCGVGVKREQRLRVVAGRGRAFGRFGLLVRKVGAGDGCGVDG